MLDGLLGRGFAAKCKSLIKLTKNRIDVIRRKRRATEKFLKKDIADLLASGLDINAFGRAEGLIVELTLSSCYDFVEHVCELVLKHLSVMQKLSGCPEECREAVSTLMFAAARFSDLPELRDLRQMFQERYGDSIECYVNQEFAASLNLKSSTSEKKVRLMKDIASEFSINWDSKAFELRMSRPSASAQGHNTFKSNHPSDNNHPLHDKDATPKGVKYDFLQKGPVYPNDGHKFQNAKESGVLKSDENDLHSKSKLPENGFKQPNSCNDVKLKRDSHGNPFPRGEELISKKSDRSYWKEGSMIKPIGSSSHDNRVEQFEGASNQHDSWGNATLLRGSQDTATARKSPSHAGFHSKSNVNEPFAVNHSGLRAADYSERKVQKDETPRVKSYYNNAVPPPYVKPISKVKNSIHGSNLVSSHVERDSNPLTHPSVHEKSDASTSERVQLGLNDSEQDWQGSRHGIQKQSHEKEQSIHEDATAVPVMKPKSMRRKHSKLQSSSPHDVTSNKDAEVVRSSRSRRRDESRRGLQILFDDEQHKNDEEERVIDRLLIHYSKKSSIPVLEKARRKSKRRHHEHQMNNSTRESQKNGSRNGPDETSERVTHPSRSVSLPPEEREAVEINKVYNRAASFGPAGEARHVHPKLPDYDDLAARMAALRGT